MIISAYTYFFVNDMLLCQSPILTTIHDFSLIQSLFRWPLKCLKMIPSLSAFVKWFSATEHSTILFFKNLLFSHTICPNSSLLSLHSSSSPHLILFSPRYTAPLFPFRKKKSGTPGIVNKHGMKRYNKTKHKPPYQG